MWDSDDFPTNHVDVGPLMRTRYRQPRKRKTVNSTPLVAEASTKSRRERRTTRRRRKVRVVSNEQNSCTSLPFAGRGGSFVLSSIFTLPFFSRRSFIVPRLGDEMQTFGQADFRMLPLTWNA